MYVKCILIGPAFKPIRAAILGPGPDQPLMGGHGLPCLNDSWLAWRGLFQHHDGV